MILRDIKLVPNRFVFLDSRDVLSKQELGNLIEIDTLMLNRNFLTGPIPTSFFGLNDLGKRKYFAFQKFKFQSSFVIF